LLAFETRALAKGVGERQFGGHMKSKIGVVILVVVCLVLGVALVTREKKAQSEKKELESQLTYQSNQVKQTQAKLEEQRQVNMSLEGDLKTRANELTTLSNSLNKTISDLEKSDAQAKATAEQLRSAQAELAKKDEAINKMEAERAALGKQMDQLTNNISGLEQLIASTQQKLAKSEGDKTFLMGELKRLQAEKAELERQFNDLAVMRAQVSKLKEELAISRRLEFIRLSLFGATKGGAEKLMAHTDKNPANAATATNFNLDVEVRQTGGAKVVAPTNATPVASNSAAIKPVVTNAAATLPKDAPAAPPK
jgi:septal ring factor EnvC (AmiA/AmiB activator)